MKSIIKIMCVFFLLIYFIGCIDFSTSKTIYVGENEDFIKIQEAIDNANNGDTVFVKRGIYTEILKINKTINLVGESGENTVIQQPFNTQFISNNIISIDEEGCVVKDFKIIGAGTYTESIGIMVNSSKNNISNNIVSENFIGIKLNDLTSNNVAYKNRLYNNQYGISLDQSKNNNVSKNNITSSVFYGIYLQIADGNNVYNNYLSENRYGIKAKASEQNEIFRNVIIKNNDGIDICCGSGNNNIYLNIFVENTVNANDILFNNWDNGKVGNYWDDYFGNDEDGDGIGDIPYNITGDLNFDRFPLMYKNFK
jgi:parallel beta-helix repeat protein